MFKLGYKSLNLYAAIHGKTSCTNTVLIHQDTVGRMFQFIYPELRGRSKENY